METMSKKEVQIFKPAILLICALYFIIGNMGDIMMGDEYHFFWEDVIWKSRD